MHFVIDLMVIYQIVHITYVLCIYYRLLTALIERKKYLIICRNKVHVVCTTFTSINVSPRR